MKYHASQMDQGEATYAYSRNWDANMIFGCECDAGWQGYNCGLRTCATGDDPMTTGQVDEVQLIRCDIDPTSGFRFTLSFRHETTVPIAVDATQDVVHDALEALTTIRNVEVQYNSATGTYNRFCDDSGPTSENIIQIRFRTNHGEYVKKRGGGGGREANARATRSQPRTLPEPLLDRSVPRLVVKDVDGTDLDGAQAALFSIASNGAGLTRSGDGATLLSESGTKEDLPCSGRGKCNTGTGICECYTGFSTSDGRGNTGDFGDCGYAEDPITSCPGIGIECSGHGVCSDHPSYKCSCSAGWTGGDCSERTCPMGRAWFDEPVADDTAHRLAECSNRGICDRVRGKCVCQPQFDGEACERTLCPGKQTPQGICSGHGRCLTMAALAEEATLNGDATPHTYGLNSNNANTWDSKSIVGCFCDEGWEGYDCSLRSCPWGDDASTDTQADEVQTLTCELLAGSPTFQIMFRREITEPIPATASAEDVEDALGAIASIGAVSVMFDGANTQACSASPGTVISVRFTTEHGDLPPMTVLPDEGFTQGVDLSFTSLTATEAAKGTKENSLCNERGLCNYKTGNCECFIGYGSSDGAGGRGDRGDCGYREPILPISRSWSSVNNHGGF